MRRIFFFLAMFFSSSVWAAGFIDHHNGTPYRWASFPIHYMVDGGPLNGSVDHATAVTEVQNAFQRWQDVPVAQVSFTNDGDLPDVTASNISSYVTIDSTGSPRNVGSETVVILDSDGSIINAFLGAGASSVTLGLASAGKFDDTNFTILAGLAIMNGGVTTSEFRSTMTHEFGHMLNLAHSQVNYEEAFDGNTANDDKIPTMLSFLAQGEDITQLLTLNPDDQYSLSYLYPNAAALASTGTLSGSIIRRKGEGVRGVNVICRNQADPRFQAVSWISDSVLGGLGAYQCGNLTPGNYQVQIEPVALAINIFDPDPPFIVSESYSGSKESYDSAVDLDPITGNEVVEPVAVTAGATTSNINIMLNEDGRLVSGKTVQGTAKNPFSAIPSSVVPNVFPSLEYFITVPPGATKVKFDLKAEDPNVDLDIMGRCDTEFSIPINSTAYPLIASSGTQQAEFATTSTSGTETFELTGTTSPKLKNCTYHLLIVNFSADVASAPKFSFVATVSGGNPNLVIRDDYLVTGALPVGETAVLKQTFEANEENFRMSGVTYTEANHDHLANVSSAKLYVDDDNDGKFSSGDRLIATATPDVTTGKVVFTGADEYIDASGSKIFFVTYTATAAAASIGAAGWFWLSMCGLFFFVIGRRRAAWVALTMFLVTCSSSGGNKIEPRIEKTSDLHVVGVTYGDAITVSLGSQPSSVDDFFK